MNNQKIQTLLSSLDGSGSDSEWEAVKELRSLGDALPPILLKKYHNEKKWKIRCACVYHAMRHSREVEAAYKLGVDALSDRSKVVRYQACELLAWSLNKDAIPLLKNLELSETEDDVKESIQAVIDAIEYQNSNYFIDRDHSGMMTFNVS